MNNIRAFCSYFFGILGVLQTSLQCFENFVWDTRKVVQGLLGTRLPLNATGDYLVCYSFCSYYLKFIKNTPCMQYQIEMSIKRMQVRQK